MKPFLNSLSGKSKMDITTFTGGLNVCYDKSAIKDNQMTYMWNVVLKDPMTLSTRSNRTSLAWFLNDTTNYGTGKIYKMFTTSDKTLITIEKHGDSMHVYEWYKSDNQLTKVYRGAVEYSTMYSIAECRDSSSKYIFISTWGKLYKLTKNVFDNTLVDVTNASNPVCGVLASHKNRLFVARGIDLYMSKLRQYDDFTVVTSVDDEKTTPTPTADEDTGHQIRVTEANGDIQAIIPYDGKLIILCNRSMHVLYGSSPYQEVEQFSLINFDNGLGCVSAEAVTICDNILYWLDSDMSVYRYNGSSIIKVSEPYGTNNYASYGGISEIAYNPIKIKSFVMSSYGSYLYLSITRSRLVGAENDTLLVYDTKTRIWWAEDGNYSHLAMLETDTNTPFFYSSDYLIGATHDNDIQIMNAYQKTGEDLIFNMTTRQFDTKEIKYAFETKTMTLGTVKNKKTLTNVWLQANATARLAVCDYWSNHNPWDEIASNMDKNYLVLGSIKRANMRHNVQDPYFNLHEGNERHRFIIPRMYMQKINSFSIRIEGEGQGEFYMMEKEWRIR